MRRAVLWAGLLTAAGCGRTPTIDTKPLTAEQKAAIKAEDDANDQGERGTDAGLVKKKR